MSINDLTRQANNLYGDLDALSSKVGEYNAGHTVDAFNKCNTALAALDAVRRELAWAKWKADQS